MPIIKTSPSHPSSNAADINLTLSEKNNQIDASTNTEQSIFSKNERLDLYAQGSDGLSGQNGIDGSNGLAGKNGLNATPSSDASDGQDGTPGSNATAGTNGGDAGHGGHIVVSVNEQDLALLPIINQVNYAAGRPGAPGRHGTPGQGGAGGAAGRSCTYYIDVPYQVLETHHRTRRVAKTITINTPYIVQHSHDNTTHGHHNATHGHHSATHGHHNATHSHHNATHGHHNVAHNHHNITHTYNNTHQRTETIWVDEPYTVEELVTRIKKEERQRPAGRAGRTGNAGIGPTHRLVPGKQGTDGSYTIQIIDNSGDRLSTHKTPYNLQLSIAAANNNYIYEPGENCSLSCVAHNKGVTMSSPIESMPVIPEKHSQITWSNDTSINGAIAAGTSRMAAQSLQLKINPITHDGTEPYSSQATVDVNLLNTRLGKNYSSRSCTFNITYPIALKTVKNNPESIALQASKSLGSTVARAVRVQVTDAAKQTVASYDIEEISPNKPWSVHTKTIGFGEKAWLKAPNHYQVSLFLKPMNTEKLTLIQQRPMTIEQLFHLPLWITNTYGSQSNIWSPGDSLLLTWGVDNSLNAYDYPSTNPLTLELELASLSNESKKDILHQPILKGQKLSSSKQIEIKCPFIENAKANSYIQKITMTAKLSSAMGLLDSRTFEYTQQYPVQLELNEHEYYQANGEPIKLNGKIKNISTTPLTGKVHVKIINQSNKEIVSTDLPLLDAQSQQNISFAKPFFDPAQQYYQNSEFLVNLYFNPFNSESNKTPTLIQQHKITTCTVPIYTPENKKITLVFDESLKQLSLINKWWQFLNELSSNQVAIYDKSYYQSHPELAQQSIKDLLTARCYGTVLLLNCQWANDVSISPSLLLDIYQQFYASLITIGTDKSSSTASLEEHNKRVEDSTTHTNNDDLMRTLLNPELKTYRHYLAISDGKNSALRAKQLQKTLTHVFPNRTYQVIAEPQERRINIRRLADPTYESAPYISNTDITDKKTQQNVINALPFSQKLSFFTLNENIYREQLALSIKEDLAKEQKRISETQAYGSWWQRIHHHFDQSQIDMRHLHALIDYLKHYHDQGDFTSFEAWSPLVLNMLIEVKKQVEQNITYWDLFLHLFIPQTKVQCTRAASTLFDNTIQKIKVMNAAIPTAPLASVEVVEAVEVIEAVEVKAYGR